MLKYLGMTVEIEIDRPMGYIHGDIVYPVNYGYIPGTRAGDGEEIDVYLLGVKEPVQKSRCRIIGLIHREDDVEDKLVGAPEGMIFYQNEILEQTWFQERYFQSTVTALYEKSCGAVIYTVEKQTPRYLLLRSWRNGDCGFPKGHMEFGETEIQTALREIKEETSLDAVIQEGFRREIHYVMPNGRNKTVVFYLAEYQKQIPCHNEGFEFSDYLSLPYEEAMRALTHRTSKDILEKAHQVIVG